jgi:hypothetical protein
MANFCNLILRGYLIRTDWLNADSTITLIDKKS